MKLPILTAFMVINFCITSGCSRSKDYDQIYHENFFASILARSLEVSERIGGKDYVLTNLLVLTNHVRIEVLADYETRFLQFGDSAGFTNSLLDRYILLPKGAKGPPPDLGDIVLIGTKPIKKQNGKLERIFVAKYPKLSDSFGADWIEEEVLQQALHDAGVRLSDLPPVPPLPSMRKLYDPKGEIAATQRMLSKELDKEIEKYEREHSTPLWQHPGFPYVGMVIVTIGAGALLWWFSRDRSK